MKFYQYTEQKTPQAILSFYPYKFTDEQYLIYRGNEGTHVVVIEATESEMTEWASKQLVPMNEITEAEFIEFRNNTDSWALEWEWKKRLRAEELSKSTVTVNDIIFDADEDSMNRMNRLLSLANAQYTEYQAQGMTEAEAYDKAYNAVISWKAHDNNYYDIPLKTLIEVQEKALENMQVIWEKYDQIMYLN